MSQKLRKTLLSARAEKSALRDGKLEGIVRVTVFPVQWPSNLLVQRLEGSEGSLRNMAHDGVHGLALVISLFTLDNILGRNSTLGKIDVS